MNEIINSIDKKNFMFKVDDCRGISFMVFKTTIKGVLATIALGVDHKKGKAIVGAMKPGIITKEKVKALLDDNYKTKDGVTTLHLYDHKEISNG